MKIVHIQDYFQPVLGYQETFLPREQAKMGHEVYVVASDRYSPRIYSENKDLLGNRIKGAGFFIEQHIKVWRLKTIFEMLYQPWVLGLEGKIEELNPDIVIMHGVVNFSALRIARLRKKLGNFKLIYDDHMTFDNSRSKLRILYPVFRWTLSRLIQEAADALVAILPETKVFMYKRYGIPLERITVIPLGADDELFKFDALARQEIRNKLSVNDSDTVFIYTGKVIPEKRLDMLIEAVKLMKNNQGVKVLFVGSGFQPYFEKLERGIREAGMENKFIWHEAVPNEELYQFYSAADVAVWPRGASISQREAMACGLPIIISEASTVIELVDYDNGLICREGDAEHLAQQMEKLLDPQLRRKMGDNSRRAIEERLSWRVIAKQFIELAEERVN